MLDIIAGSGDDLPMRFAGGKNKCYQRLINLIPPHDIYVETHLGSGAVMRHKRPARYSVGFERDPQVVEMWLRNGPPSFELVCGDVMSVLDVSRLGRTDFVYADPPYLPETRRRARVYRFDYCSEDHEALLTWLRSLSCMVMVSGYRSALYDSELADWERTDFIAKTHAGVRVESVWMNYSPVALHDARYVGDDFRQREKLRRLSTRWATRFGRLARLQQQCVLEQLQHVYGGPTI